MRAWMAVIAGVAVAAGTFVAAASAAPSGELSASDDVRLLEVPYVPQSEALCGGAALAMVLRYWGAPGVQSEDFADLVDPGTAGIRTDVLVGAVRARGWTALPITGTASVVQQELARGRPIIALTGTGSGSYHYVVLVAWANGGVIAHDPAVGPYRVSRERKFDAAWARSGRWALLLMPSQRPAGSQGPTPPAADSDSSVGVSGCDAIVEEGVRQARSGDVKEAELRFLAAAALCPAAAAPLRELAGLRFNADDWAGAAGMAERALALEPDDSLTWRLLAGSRFLAGDVPGALDAWNQLAEPRTDLTRIDGLSRIRYRVVTDQLDLSPGRLLTSGDFLRARRRLEEIPAQTGSRLGVKPLAGGVAQVDVALLERPLLFDGAWDAAGAALTSITDRAIRLGLASLSGNGELWTADYGWWKERPHLSLALAVPTVAGRPGIWRVERLWERQTYAIRETSTAGDTTGSRVIREERRRTSLSFADWVGPNLRLEARVSLDRWLERGAYASVEGSLEARSAGDHLALNAAMGGWASSRGTGPFRTGSLVASWRSRTSERGGWLGRGGIQRVSLNAPLALWPGAGTGHARAPLLRAHPLLAAGVLNGRVFGRTLAHAGLEKQGWPWSVGPLRLGWAVFVDVARPWDTAGSGAVPWQTDGGVGLRLGGPGRRGQLRLDVARGFQDGTSAVSASWEPPWPGGR